MIIFMDLVNFTIDYIYLTKAIIVSLYVSDNLVAMAEQMTEIAKGMKERLSNITGNVFHVVAEKNSLIR